MPARITAHAASACSVSARQEGARARTLSVPYGGREGRGKTLGVSEDPIAARRKNKGDLGDYFPLRRCIKDAKPRVRWTSIDGMGISCQGKSKTPCGNKQRCIFCLARAVAQTYFGRSREVTYAAIECARGAGWTEADSLSRMILKLMKASVELRYDKHLSHYGGLTVPVHDLERHFRRGAGTDIFPQRRRS